MPVKLIFFDTSALFAAIYSETGGARELTRLSEVGAIRLIISPEVVLEIENVVGRKLRKALVAVGRFIDTANIEVGPSPNKKALEFSHALVNYKADAIVLAGALTTEVDYFVTFDRKDFIKNQELASKLPFPMGLPGDCLQWLRTQWA